MPRKEKTTFIEEARRKQIIDAALQTIAEQGYTQTSFAEIAKTLGITKGLIAYHFNGKHDLITSAIDTILSRQGAYIREQVEKETHASDKLRVYIQASFEYIAQNRSQFVALVDLWGSFTSPEEKKIFSESAYDPCRTHLKKIFRVGAEQGVLAEFDEQVMASVIQGAIDGIMLQWVFDPKAVNLQDASLELGQMFGKRVIK
ncbi:MAG: TetR family transcriptional regulator [Chloroflexi bacterium]|nr:TetR family transcriptional regulator [Chloroflexota bacterium]MBP8056034.1 TetR family transcriptional regulator [Chloroflexota bacterium]